MSIGWRRQPLCGNISDLEERIHIYNFKEGIGKKS
jgi:hypothetical protein